MNSVQEDTSYEAQSDTILAEKTESYTATRRRSSTSDHLPQSSSSVAKAEQPASQRPGPVPASKGLMLASRPTSSNSQLLEESARSHVAASGGFHAQNRPRQATQSSFARTGGKIEATLIFGASSANESEPRQLVSNEGAEPASKRYKLSDDGWIEDALRRAQAERGAPDPSPIPQLTPHGHPLEPSAYSQPNTAANQSRLQPSPHWLSPPRFGRSPTIRSATLSRRPSSTHSTSSPSHSPALTHRSNTSTNRRVPPSPSDGSVMGGFSDLEISSRAPSRAPEVGDSDATFAHIHNVPQVELPPRETPNLSRLERLPRQVFMRIMMYCGYKSQVLLKKSNYNLYLAVDLKAVPWEEKTATILFEERNNPTNFPKKASKPQNNEGGNVDDEEGSKRVNQTTKRKKESTRAASDRQKDDPSKNKAHIDIYGKWGCYCCYKILPAHYFEGALLEDKEGRTAKGNKSRGADIAESDKKVDMRVEYVQILGTVRGSNLPDWLFKAETSVDATSVGAYVREKMEAGGNCDDLRAYYKGITRDTHLVGPIRGITPAFTPSSTPKSSVNKDSIGKPSTISTNLYPDAMSRPLPVSQFGRREKPVIHEITETTRPLYRLHAVGAARVDTDAASYCYQIEIPNNAERDTKPLLLPNSDPVARVCLPSKISNNEPILEVGNVVTLRRICIPCGTKFAVYRRNCNRKIISKTDEQWWVCDCPEVRLAGRSTGCSTCGRKVIY